jgi:hypothetical protein
MFNAHHATAVLGCHQEPIGAAECRSATSRTTVNDGQPILKPIRMAPDLHSDLGFPVELWGFELLTSCMPCLTIPSGGVALGPIPGGQAGSTVWLPLALSETV